MEQSAQEKSYRFPLVILTSLFFMWGFITCLNDILIPHLKNAFSLNYTQAMLIQFCFFGAYFVVSLPAGSMVKKIGYQRGIVAGLVVAGIGCALFYPAAGQHSYAMFLGALFVLAAGITILQVSANPYVAILGDPRTASSRLTLTQAFNSLGTAVAPFFGAFLILGAAATIPDNIGAASKAGDASSVQLPYLMLAGALFILALVFAFIRLPDIIASEERGGMNTLPVTSAWKERHLVLGAAAIFLYVGAEVSIGSFLINFIGQDNIAGLKESEAAHFVAYYWGAAMVGRFIGAGVMQKVSAGLTLSFSALMASVMVIFAISLEGHYAMWAILSVGLFNSIMFPTIFSLAVQHLGTSTSQGSGILCMAIVGGAVMPVIQGMLADTIGIQPAFILPALCYLYIIHYGLKGHIPVNMTIRTDAV